MAQRQPARGGAGAAPRPQRADVIAAYDLGVDSYEERWSPVILPAVAALLPSLVLADHGVVLDVGAGTGGPAAVLRSARPDLSVLAVDASSAMLQVAHTARGLPAVLADAMALPIGTASADAVLMAYVLFHLQDPLTALCEAARVLRPGGVVGTVTWASERTEVASVVWSDALTDAGVPPLPLRSVDTDLDRPERLGAMLQRAGFMPTRIWPVVLTWQWDFASFWSRVSRSGGTRQRLALIDPDARAVLLERARSKLEELRPDDYRWEGTVICAVAGKAG